MQFSELGLSEPILRAAADQAYTIATPIQAKAIPLVIAGRDVLGSAQTGTGKTAAFAMPILHRLGNTHSKRPRCLVLAPTRELASQIAESFRAYGRHLPQKLVTLFGGVNQNPQVGALQRGVDIIVATPGRLLDLHNQGHLDLREIRFFVLDEADRMLDMGFIHDIRKVVKLIPHERQTLMFSATMPPEIRRLADSILRNPASVQVAPVSSTAERVEQHVYHVDRPHKAALLAHLVEQLPIFRGIVFTRTKRGADRLVKQLRALEVHSEAIHGNKSQNNRTRALQRFAGGKLHLLIATDIASRGIDIQDISHVINYDLTHEPETYVHRIGRTARAGASGVAISLCDDSERENLRAIEKLTRQQLRSMPLPPQFASRAPAPPHLAHRPTPRPQPIHHPHPRHNHRADPARPAERQQPPVSGPRQSPSAPRPHPRGAGQGKARPQHPTAPRPQPKSDRSNWKAARPRRRGGGGRTGGQW